MMKEIGPTGVHFSFEIGNERNTLYCVVDGELEFIKETVRGPEGGQLIEKMSLLIIPLFVSMTRLLHKGSLLAL